MQQSRQTLLQLAFALKHFLIYRRTGYEKADEEKLAVLLSLVLIISLALAGCKKKEEIPEPHKLAEAYYLLYTRGNTEELVKYGITEADAKKALKSYKTSMKSSFMTSANYAGGMFKSEDADKVIDSILHALAKLKYEVKTDEKDEEEGTATVILKTQSINLAKIQSELMKDMQNAIKSGKIKKKEQLGSYILSKMAELIKRNKAYRRNERSHFNHEIKNSEAK